MYLRRHLEWIKLCVYTRKVGFIVIHHSKENRVACKDDEAVEDSEADATVRIMTTDWREQDSYPEVD